MECLPTFLGSSDSFCPDGLKNILPQLLWWFSKSKNTCRKRNVCSLLGYEEIKRVKWEPTLNIVPVQQSSSTKESFSLFAVEEMGSLDFTFQHQVIWTLEDVSERDQTSAAGSTSREKTETRRVEANVLLCTYFLPCVGAPHAIFTFTETSHSVKSCHTWVKRKDIVLKYDFSWSECHWKFSKVIFMQ